MKILYSAGNRIGANNQLARFLQNINSKHEIKIAAYLKSSSSITHVEWTLDALQNNIIGKKDLSKMWNLFGHKGTPRLNLENAIIFLNEVKKYNPDLIICDGEPIAAHVAKTLNINLWYCSPLHLLDGVKWFKNQFRYFSLLEVPQKWIRRFPEANKYFIYSPFGDIKFRPLIRDNYEWITPYYIKTQENASETNIAVINNSERYSSLAKLLNTLDIPISLFSPFKENLSNIQSFKLSEIDFYQDLLNKSFNWFFTTGDTNYLSDAFYNEKEIIISPTLQDPETLVNAILVKYYNIGYDLAQVELMDEFAIFEIEKSLNKIYSKDYLSVQNYKTLDEKIEELCI